MTPRQYGRLVSDRFVGIRLDPHVRTHSLRRTKATLIYRAAPGIYERSNSCSVAEAMFCFSSESGRRADIVGPRRAEHFAAALKLSSIPRS